MSGLVRGLFLEENPNLPSKLKVFIDPGHGGKDPGAVGPAGLKESDINLSISKILYDMLSSRYKVALTRYVDVYVSLAQRGPAVKTWNPSVAVSVHCNSNGPTAKGIEVWTARGQDASDVFATFLYDSLEGALPSHSFRTDYADGDPDKEKNYNILFDSKPIPIALVETEFISNPMMENFLSVKANQIVYASSIAAAIDVYLR